ncbi:serine/threonine protein kinase [Streptomyces sp. NPDC004296]|uniref:serine/threonine protein kinase n=1 Tax=Streptomyces sp. NPDC004296 TaxID=3364697 RepID=UPI0036BE4043
MDVGFRFPSLREADPRVIGNFRPVARLGEGGMGQVFLAFTPGGQPAAVKVIRSELTQHSQFGQRFVQEVRTAQKVHGAHIAPLLDAAPEAEQPWLATMYVPGPSLRDLVEEHGPLPDIQVLMLAWGITHALIDIHAANVVHRDMKPHLTCSLLDAQGSLEFEPPTGLLARLGTLSRCCGSE